MDKDYFESKKYYYTIKRNDDYAEMCVTPVDYYKETGYVWDREYPDDFYDAIEDIGNWGEEMESYFMSESFDMTNEEFEAKMAEHSFTMIYDEGFANFALN